MSNLIPIFKWAQDKTHVFIEIDLVGIKDQKVNLKENKFEWSGTVGDKKYALDLELHAPIDVSKSTYKTTRLPEFLLEKKDSKAKYWPHLLTPKDKAQYKGRCQVDFDKYVDEDEEKESLSKQFGGGGYGFGGDEDDGGLGGLGGGGGADMSKLMSMMNTGGGMGGMGGLGGDEPEDTGDKGGDKDKNKDEEEDLPELEDEPDATS